MSVLGKIDLERLSPSRLWSAVDPEVREAAARAGLTSEDEQVQAEAHLSLAMQLRFRPASIKTLPIDKRVRYLARQVRPDDSLASSLLLALHLGDRRALLGTFLDCLEIPHEDGLIDGDHDVEPPSEEALAGAAAALFEAHDDAHVELYLAALLALDPETWGGLRPVLEARAAH